RAPARPGPAAAPLGGRRRRPLRLPSTRRATGPPNGARPVLGRSCGDGRTWRASHTADTPALPAFPSLRRVVRSDAWRRSAPGWPLPDRLFAPAPSLNPTDASRWIRRLGGRRGRALRRNPLGSWGEEGTGADVQAHAWRLSAQQREDDLFSDQVVPRAAREFPPKVQPNVPRRGLQEVELAFVGFDEGSDDGPQDA